MKEFGLYLHIPFCKRKCPYCGFASMAGGEVLFEDYARAVKNEIERRMTGVFSGKPHTVYIGGGTPSCYPASLLLEIVEAIIRKVPEVTVEANPESATKEWFGAMRCMGVNRVSIGVQSLDNEILGNLGRIHTSDQAVRAIETAEMAGFRRISADLMFGIPGQTLETWVETLKSMVELPLDHVSCYSLSLEEGTPFLTRFGNDSGSLPSPDATVEMYRLLVDILGSRGFERYELSNFAKPGHECVHNEGYWSLRPYLGIGAGAHSFDGARRTWNVPEPESYIWNELNATPALSDGEDIDEPTRALETIMLSLRRREGLDFNDFSSVYRLDPGKFRKLAARYISEGFLEEMEEGCIRITTKGVMVADEITAELASDFLK